MPLCPNCRYEFENSVKTCPECKVDLVERLDDAAPTDEDFVEIYAVGTRLEADVVRGILEEEKLEVLVRDTRVFPVLPDWRAEFVIAVPVAKEAAAKKLLEDARADGALGSEGKFLR